LTFGFKDVQLWFEASHTTSDRSIKGPFYLGYLTYIISKEVQSKGVEIVSGSEYPFCGEKTTEGGTNHRHGKANHNREPSVKDCLGQHGRMGTEESAGVHTVSSGGRNR